MRKIKKKDVYMKQKYTLFWIVVETFSLLFCYMTIEDRKQLQATAFQETGFFIQCEEPKGVYTYSLEEYLTHMMLAIKQVEAKEYPEAYKALAVVCRTMLWQEWERQGRSPCIEVTGIPSITLEEYKRLEKNAIQNYRIELARQAVSETAFLILDTGDTIGYCSLSNGKARAYQSDSYVVCDYDRKNKEYYHEKRISGKELQKKLSTNTDASLWKIQKDASGYVERVILEDQSVMRGEEIRKKLSLFSDDWEIRKDEDDYLFCTRGLGHGYGLSIAYSQILAANEKSYEEILKIFFPQNHLERRTVRE